MKRFRIPKTIVFHRNNIIVGYRENVKEPLRTREWKRLESDLAAQTYGYVVTHWSKSYLDLHIGIDYKVIL
jgi:hypothetical protein